MMKVSVNVFDGRYILAYKLYVISADTPKTTWNYIATSEHLSKAVVKN